ncbi:SLC13 family permease [Paralimibaculum aggregatum]|uniref:SLC13 family permease n=1 Tax=Paralimibaculum aggregatum TaxID=3036245 RepID=A0ABQ6LN77_9RHOB|nr:SLC13 family permease [Limibaculum sp. NKW23]GMG84660.1 SLC13 family permease [Limibaculum sp. NKW23]
MTPEQAGLFAIFGSVFALLVWGRIRYDLVAFAALIIGVVAGLVPTDHAFSGFGHPAVVIIALVLLVSRALSNSGAVELIASRLISGDRPTSAHIGIMSVAGAALSAVINNVAALALLMPLDIEAAERAKRAVAQSLMPLSFATILGGMITMIGTPPNIVIAQYREGALGEPFQMFDFAPVGLLVAVAGIAFVTLIGWRLLPSRAGAEALLEQAETELYVAELLVGEGSKSDGVTLGDLYPMADEADINLLGLIRRGRRLPGFSRREPIQAQDTLVVEGDPKAIEGFMGKAGLDFAGSERHEGGITGGSLTLMEAIVPDGARIAGRTAMGMQLLYREGVTLLGIARRGQQVRDRVRLMQIEPGDVLLFLGSPERLDGAARSLGILPLEGRRTGVVQRRKAGLAIGIFAAAILAAVAGLVYLPVALAACAVAYAGLGLIGGGEVYEAIEWKVIVLLASLIPLGEAFEASGGAELIAGGIVDVTQGLPAWVILLALMVVTMTLSDFLNNVATTLIAAPVAVQIAGRLEVSADPFLMGVAVAASCAFLTPIGHKNNTIIMGPGGYRFGDYWRMGLPLELLVLAIAVPAILTVWPL